LTDSQGTLHSQEMTLNSTVHLHDFDMSVKFNKFFGALSCVTFHNSHGISFHPFLTKSCISKMAIRKYSCIC